MAIYNKFFGYTVIVKSCDFRHRPIVSNFMYYDDALEFLERKMKELNSSRYKVAGCIMNGKLDNICYTTEVGPDAES